MDSDAFRVVPRIFANYVQCTLENDQASLIFAQRTTVQEPDKEPVAVALPQVMVFLTIGQFLKMAEMIENQANAARQALSQVSPELVKENLMGHGSNTG